MYWKKSLIYIIILSIMAMLMIAAQSEISQEQQIVKDGKYVILTGILNIHDSHYALQSDSVLVDLFLAPETYLKRRGADLDDKDTLVVTGFYSNHQMLVSTIKEGTNTTIIRSEIGTPYIITNDQKTYASNPAKCIGTTLCAQNCPTKAITMVKAKAVTDSSKCISCGICQSGNGTNFKGCPVNAVHQLK
jgi:ferredoxin